MADSIFAKIIIFFASILTVSSGSNYINLGADNLTFDFRTGGNYPIYHYLNVQNAGPGTERFEISSNQDWVFVYREGTGYNFVELPRQAYINFVLEIHPERLADGANEAKVNLRVLDIESLVSQELILDEAEVLVTVNKNVVPTPSPTAAVTSILSPTPSQDSIISPQPTPSATPVQSPSVQERIQDSQLDSILKQLQSLIDSLRVLVQKLFQ